MKKLYFEIFEEFERADTKEKRLKVLRENATPDFVTFLEYTYNPKFQFYITEFPKDYVKPDVVPGIEFSHIGIELGRAYLFMKGNTIADKLTEDKRHVMLLQMLESIHERDATYFVSMMKKELNVKGLTLDLLKEALN